MYFLNLFELYLGHVEYPSSPSHLALSTSPRPPRFCGNHCTIADVQNFSWEMAVVMGLENSPASLEKEQQHRQQAKVVLECSRWCLSHFMFCKGPFSPSHDLFFGIFVCLVDLQSG